MTEKISLKELDQRVEPDMCGEGEQNQVKEVDISHRLAGPNARLIGKPGGLLELTTPAMVLESGGLRAKHRSLSAPDKPPRTAGTPSRQEP
jgi:hypothetical protein